MGNSEGKGLWGGRFESSTDETFKKFNRSFGFDVRLFEADIEGSVGHCDGLVVAGVISEAEGVLIKSALNELAKRAVADPSFLDDEDCEDVHSFIETHLIASIGDVGRKVHTGRSRNDQVTTALRIWLRRELDAASEAVRKFQAALVESAERHRDAVIPGYTHLQRAQPILWAHWCLAYFEMLERDRERISDARKRVNIMPLGSGAISGSGFRVDRAGVASSLGFDGITRNSLDAVSDRDFVIEATSVAATAMMHLSRFAEDLIIYSSAEFGLIRLGDAISTGSSLMPQKKNPDALELIRGKSSRVFGHHAALLTLMKGLPLAYNKDMQED
ncbi:MAG: argininosuccinate lyase, partial [Acidobacteriota bacterium]